MSVCFSSYLFIRCEILTTDLWLATTASVSLSRCHAARHSSALTQTENIMIVMTIINPASLFSMSLFVSRASSRPAALNETLLKTSTSLAFCFNERTSRLHAEALCNEPALLFFQNNMDAAAATAAAAADDGVLIFSVSVGRRSRGARRELDLEIESVLMASWERFTARHNNTA